MASERDFARLVLIAVGITALVAALAAVLAIYFYLPLMIFAAILGAILLDGIASPLARRLRLPRRVAVCAVSLLALAILAVGLGVSGPGVVEQSRELVERLPEALNRLERFAGGTGWGRVLLPAAEEGWDVERVMSRLGGIWKPIAGVFATAVAALSGALVVAVLAVFLALDPGVYISGLLHLVSPPRRPRLEGVLRAMSRALRWWLVGRLASMAVVGLLSMLGLALLGVPLAMLLGLLAAALSFIPYLGPVVSAVPAVLVGLGESTELAVWIVALYTAIQISESYLVTPLIQERTVFLPPAILILAQLAMGGLFGVLGLLVATPLAVAGIVAIQTLYVQDILGDPIALMGDHGGRASPSRKRSGEEADDEALADPEGS